MKYGVREETSFLGADDERNHVELADEEFILDAEYRGANRIVLAIATPVEEEYMCGVNDCGRTVDGPDEVCWQHQS